MIFLRILLYPFAVLYDMVTRIRNYLYQSGGKQTFTFKVPVIAVGNLSVGGTGKTPMIEYLIRLLQPNHQIATLSRGYGRTTKGLRIGSPTENATSIGDEPFQLFKNFGRQINVVVAEDRARAIPHILEKFPVTNVILLDDAFQHRSVKPQLNILLTSYLKPFFTDFLLPSGRLRESRSNASRADVVVVTKCEAVIPENEMHQMTRRIQKYAGSKPVFFTTIRYGKPHSFNDQPLPWSNDVVLVSGVAQAGLFEAYASSVFHVVKHFEFPDHHRFRSSEIESVASFVKSQSKPAVVLTTEKDVTRLMDIGLAKPMKEVHWFYLPIETVFIKNGAEFDSLVIKCCQVQE